MHHLCVFLEVAVSLWVSSSITHPLSFEAWTLMEPGASYFSTRLTDPQGQEILSSASQTQPKGYLSKQPSPAADIPRYLILGPLFAQQVLCQSNHVLIP